MTAAPLQPTGAAAAAPVLAYHTATPDPTGLHVEGSADGLLLSLYPQSIPGDLKRTAGLGMIAGLVLAAVTTFIVTMDHPMGAAAAAGRFVVHCAFSLPIMAAFTAVIVLWLRATLRIEVSARAVVVTVSGFRLFYQDTWTRAEIVDVQSRFFGIRLARQGRRRGEWIAFGTTAERQEILRLLRGELGL